MNLQKGMIVSYLHNGYEEQGVIDFLLLPHHVQIKNYREVLHTVSPKAVRYIIKNVAIPDPIFKKVRLTGRCADGFERDGGKQIHLQRFKAFPFDKSVCGRIPGRKSQGFALSDQSVSCPKCMKKETQ